MSRQLPANPGTWRNVERMGQRYVSRLSTIARRIENVRHIDVDLVQSCPRCRKPQLFAEVKRYLVSDAEWAQTRMFAEHYNCIAVLVVERPDDADIGVRIYNSANGEISEITWYGEDYLVRVLERARDIHVCRSRRDQEAHLPALPLSESPGLRV